MEVRSWELRNATTEGAIWMAPRLREDDLIEILASSRLAPLDALLFSIRNSAEAYEGVVNGDIICMFGVGSLSAATGRGSPWMLGTQGVQDYWLLFARISRVWIDDIRTRYASLENYVDARNALAIRWLAWLGFTIGDPVPYGPYRLPFRRIELKGELSEDEKPEGLPNLLA